jgi:DNA (cytosine-5)-methyltransferase 1
VRIGSLFSGTGGLDQGVQAVLGGTVAWHSEIDPGACKILAHRYPDVPNHGDITAVDWSAVEPVDVLTGGSPCQDLSHAGKRGGMTEGTRSNLWVAMRDAIEQLRPGLVVWENVRGAYSAPADSELESREGCLGVRGDGPVLRALGRVLGDLSELGFDAEWVGLRAADAGAPHGRFRVFVVAWPAADAVSGRRDGRAPDAVGFPFGRTTAPRGGEVASGGAAAADASSDRRDEGRTESARLVRGSDAALGGHAAADPDRDGLESVGRVHPSGRDADRRRGANRDGHAAEPATDAHPAGFCGSDESVSGDATGLHVGPVAGAGGGDRAGDPAEGVHLVGGTAPELAWRPYGDAIRRWETVLGRPAPSPTEPGSKGQPRLSPRFVEWLMGLPAGWVTDVPGLGRNEQLKALGNGVVPQQCAAALRLLLPDVVAPPASVEIGGAA